MPKVHFPIISAVFFISTLFDPSGESLATVIAAFLHELGHITVIMSRGVGIRDITVTPYGLEICTKRGYRSFFEEISVNLAGCVVNFLCFAIFLKLGGFCTLIAEASFLLGILNIMPVACLDGGSVLYASLSLFCLPDKAELICRRVSFFTLIIMWIPAVYIFLFSGCNYSLFIMCLWLFGKIFCQKDKR
jgi:Zn-dependent protease